MFSVCVAFSCIVKTFAPFPYVLGAPTQACSLSLSGLSIVLVLHFVPEKWTRIWLLLWKCPCFPFVLFNLSLYHRGSTQEKTPPEGYRGRVLLYCPESTRQFTDFHLSLFCLSLQEDNPFPLTNKLCFLSLPSFIILRGVFGSWLFMEREKISSALVLSSRVCWFLLVGVGWRYWS